MNLERVILIIALLIFLTEGFGFPWSRFIAFYLVLTLSLICLINLIYKKDKFIMPRQSFLYLLFLLFSALSIIASGSIHKSAINFLFSFFLFFILIFSYNNSVKISNILPKFILILSFCFIVYSVFLPQLFLYMPTTKPLSGFQFVYSRFGSHNHIGDFLVLGVIVCFYNFARTKKVRYLLIIPFFLYFIVISFSRTAYLTLGLISLIQVFFFFKKKLLAPIFMIVSLMVTLIVFILFFSTVTELKRYSFIRPINNYLSENYNLQKKRLVASRPYFFKEAILKFSNSPLLGVGPSNLKINYNSLSSGNSTFTSHNLFLDVLAERGLLSFLPYLSLIVITCYFSLKKVSLNSFLFLALLIMFQTDYLFLFYSVSFLFFVLIGTLLGQEKLVNSNHER